jgi:hypothetical protein
MDDIFTLLQLRKFETNAASDERRVRRCVDGFLLPSFIQDKVKIQVTKSSDASEVSQIQLRQDDEGGCGFRKNKGNFKLR